MPRSIFGLVYPLPVYDMKTLPPTSKPFESTKECHAPTRLPTRRPYGVGCVE